jgi:hypothetical protein
MDVDQAKALRSDIEGWRRKLRGIDAQLGAAKGSSFVNPWEAGEGLVLVVALLRVLASQIEASGLPDDAHRPLAAEARLKLEAVARSR